MPQYSYAQTIYDDVPAVEAAVTEMKNTLDNKPTSWCVVKPMLHPRTITLSTGNVVVRDLGEPLTDAEINALGNSDTLYNVFSIHDGDNFTEVSEVDTANKVVLLRTYWAQWNNVTKYLEIAEDFTVTEHNVTNQDLSNYV